MFFDFVILSKFGAVDIEAGMGLHKYEKEKKRERDQRKLRKERRKKAQWMNLTNVHNF